MANDLVHEKSSFKTNIQTFIHLLPFIVYTVKDLLTQIKEVYDWRIIYKLIKHNNLLKKNINKILLN